MSSTETSEQVKDNNITEHKTSEAVKLILDSLIKHYSLEKIINCIFSNNDNNEEIKRIIDYLIKTEGILKIIQILINSTENYEVDGKDTVDEFDIDKFNKTTLLEKNNDNDTDNLIKIDDEKIGVNNGMENYNIIIDDDEDDKNNIILDDNDDEDNNNNNNKINNDKNNKDNDNNKNIEHIVIDEESSITISITGYDDKDKDKNKNFIDINDFNKDGLTKIDDSNNSNLSIINIDDECTYYQGHRTKEFNNCKPLTIIGKNIYMEDDDSNKRLKYYFSLENKRFYKYFYKYLENRNANFACFDDDCKARGIYNIDSKIFKLIYKHSILYNEHKYLQHMNKFDKKYFKKLKNEKLLGIEIFV